MRVKGKENGTATISIGELYETSRMVEKKKKNYYSDGARVAMAILGSTNPSENGLYFLLTDDLLPPLRSRIATQGSLSEKVNDNYLPFRKN
jgi:hypothetical protein